MTWVELVSVSASIGYACSWVIRFAKRVIMGVKHIVPQAVQDLAIEHAKAAALAYVDNATKRNAVLAQLERAGVPENLARLAVELAVFAIKAETQK
jgi:hypothetical protein